MKSISAVIVAFVLGVAISFSPMAQPLTPPESPHVTHSVVQGNIAPEIVSECWERAKKLGDAPMSWEGPELIIVDPVFRQEGQGRLLGHYYTVMVVNDDGSITAYDRVYIYLTPIEMEKYPKLVKEILTHEMLHSIWQRKANTDYKWGMANDDSEVWVRELLGETEGIVNW